MEANGEAEVMDHETERPADQEEEEEGELKIKEEPQEVAMKDYAEDTMNELLGIYGYDGVDKSVTENLQLQHFASEDQEKANAGLSGKTVEEGTSGSQKPTGETSPNKPADKPSPITRQRSSSTSGYQLREPRVASVAKSSFLVNGGDRSLMNHYKASKSTSKKKPLPVSPPLSKKRKRHDSSSSDGSMCSCGTCDLDHDMTNRHHRSQVDIIKEIQCILDENKTLRKENKRLKAELRESLNVKQLSQDIRNLTSQLQGNSSLPLSRPPSAGSTSSNTPLKINGSAKKNHRVKKQEDTGDGHHEGDEEEDLENAEELFPDSGIILPSSRIQAALQSAQQNYRLFTRSLMEMVFTKETMAASSARGQKAMGKNAMDNANPRPPLDQNVVQAIVSRVCEEFPNIHQTLVMGVIRQKIADVRKRLKIRSNRENAQQEVV